ncbi:hypothetical protein [Fimbriimonas ginsengisoli]|uniref:Uncharacterized protein n=1 Tax=Fimbriimonas ginsengisoli Gsoil 348 TaxID=661478 RepID=A0A068NQX6_FIMGI|nr:hypothetical protein [Fimbriimonas ginsengisoli]AIE85140.1 hypothetical protein OP10G_1772 [Fimbriimonas ginsengisoli Gsoil 348]
MNFCRFFCCSAALAGLTLVATAASGHRLGHWGGKPAQATAKIGIFDLAALRAVPLDPEVIKRTESAGVITEYVRFTSVPGVRVLTVLTYPSKAKALPGILFAQRFGAIERPADAKSGFVGISVAPPVGNDDPKRMDSVGGPKYSIQASYRQLFNRDPQQSYLYHHVVALVRAMDYLETRPEINLAKTSVMGQDWTGMVVSLMHALDNRPGGYFVWQGAGFYADADGNSGDLPSRISREAYEMYGPGEYAQYGTQPIFVASPLNSDLSQLDATIEFVKNLKSPKVLAYAPNRQEVQTKRNEFNGSGMWQTYFMNRGKDAPSIGSGAVSAVNGKVRYSCTADGQTSAYLLVSYGKPGNWTGRNWHRIPMKANGAVVSADVPIYDAKVPFYAIAQIGTRAYGDRGNVPIFVEPAKLGVTSSNATYPHEIFTGSADDEIYLATYGYYDKGLLFDQPGPAGMKAATVPVYWDGMVRIKNVEPAFWRGATEVVVWLKGQGQKLKAPLNAYLAYESQNSLDRDQVNFTPVTLLKIGDTFPATWKQYRIPLKGVANLPAVDSIFFDTDFKPLQIAGLSWR